MAPYFFLSRTTELLGKKSTVLCVCVKIYNILMCFLFFFPQQNGGYFTQMIILCATFVSTRFLFASSHQRVV